MVKAKAMEDVKSYNREAFLRFESFARVHPERADESGLAKALHVAYELWLENNEDATFWLTKGHSTAQEWLKLARAAVEAEAYALVAP